MASVAASINLVSRVSRSSSDTKNKETDGNYDARNKDNGKKIAAFACVDKVVQNGYAIGMGTGTTAKYAIHRLAEKYQNGQLKDIVCVPTSFDTRQLINASGLPLGDLEQYNELDVCIDGADEVDEQLNCIKGGGGCLTQEKIVMSCSKYFYIVADSTKLSRCLGDRWKTIPLEVVPMAYSPVKRRIEQMEGGQAQLRMASRKAGPVVTDNGNFLLDWTFPTQESGRVRSTEEWTTLNRKLKMIPGVVETGLFVASAQAAYFGQSDGNVLEKKADGDRRISMLNGKRAWSPVSDDERNMKNGEESG